MASIRAFLGELKQRNVIRVAGVYAVTSWAIFQVATNLFPALNLPKWTVTLVAVLMLIGLPIAVIIAWAFEKGPEGLRRTEAAAGPKPRLNVLDWALLAGLVAVVGLSLAQMTGAFGRVAQPAKTASGPVAASSAKSIAVLPFSSFSEAKEAEYFADGLTEEVINSLANIPELKVAGRTSSFYFKGRNHDLRDIGAKLGVAHVLEGSVRRDGERIRITAQLIKVSDGFHLWSQTYDRDFKDSLAVQTEIANTVAGVLKAKILDQDSAGTRNPEAYRLTLQARGRMREMGRENLLAARSLFQQAAKLDPNLASAQAGLAQATMLLAQNHLALDFDAARQESQAAIAKALAIDPRNADAFVAQGFAAIVLNLRTGDARQSREAEAAFKRALAIEPRNPDALTYYGAYLAGEGRGQEALTILKQALDVDPLNRVALNSLAGAQARMGRVDEAIQTYKTAITLYPEFVDAPESLGSMLATRGRLDEAEPWLRRAARSKADPSAAIQLAHLYFNLGMPDDARRSLTEIREPPIAVGVVHAIDFVVKRDYRGLLAYSEAQYASTRDPFWPSVIGLAALRMGDGGKAIDQIRLISPDLLGPDPEIGAEYDTALAAAHAMNGVGLKDQAKRILDRLFVATTPPPGQPQSPVLRVRRAQAYAEMGDKTRALGELRQAVKDGYRSVVDFEDFTRIEDNLNFQGIRDDPQFRAIVAEMEADNARMREKVLAARAGARPAG